MTTQESSKRRLNELVQKLDRLRDGAPADEVIDNAFVDALVDWLEPAETLSAKASSYAATRLRKVLEDDRTVQSLRREQLTKPDNTTLGELLNAVRRKATWDLATVAAKLRIDVSLLERLERDLVPVVELGAQQIADILEVFHVRITEFARLVKRTALAQQIQRDVGTAHARSNTDPLSAQHGRDLSFALARILPDLDPDPSESEIDTALLESVSSELRRRERFDLLSG
jgi:transcriptional regulator with XRE-family HTH domain